MMKLLFLFIMFTTQVLASDVTDAFDNKDYMTVAMIFRDNQNRDYTSREIIYISHSLRKLKFYRQDIKLSIKLINKKYLAAHRKLLLQVKKGDTVDAEEYPEALKVLYWNLMNDFGNIIEGYSNSSQLIPKDQQRYLTFSKLLSELEFRESKVDKFNDKIIAHMQYLQDKLYKTSWSLSLQYISWQTETDLVSTTGKSGLLITNRGICAGGDVGVENAFYHFYVDGCAFTGSGGVQADTSSPIKYNQANVPAYGAKFGPGASMIVSPSGSRIGVRLPVIYTLQKLQQPSVSTSVVKQISPISVVASLYSRWQFEHWYFQTEFGQYVQNEQTFWGIGIGKTF